MDIVHYCFMEQVSLPSFIQTTNMTIALFGFYVFVLCTIPFFEKHWNFTKRQFDLLRQAPPITTGAKMGISSFVLWMTSFILGHGCGFTSWTVLEFLLRIGILITNMYAVGEFARVYFDATPQQRFRKTKRKGKKHRLRKERWHKRAQRRKASCLVRRNMDEAWPWDGTQEDWWDSWFYDNQHKFLHVQNYAKEYEQWCERLHQANPIAEIDSVISKRKLGVESNCGFHGRCDILDSLNTFDGQHIACFNQRATDIVMDTGATISISPNKDDFVSWETHNHNVQLSGITSTAHVRGIGRVRWLIKDDKGQLQELYTRAYYVPEALARLFSPQAYFLEHDRKSQHDGWFATTVDGFMFRWPNGATRTVKWKERRGDVLPTLSLERDTSDPGFSFLLEDSNTNLNGAQKDLLRWHWKLSHLQKGQIQHLFRQTKTREPILKSRHGVSTCDLPKCSACEFAKAHRQPKGSTVTKKLPKKSNVISDGHLRPGDLVSIDQFESSIRGRLLTSKGKEKEALKYRGGTVFYDHASGYIWCSMQISFDAAETIEAKNLFERTSGYTGIDIMSYRADQGIFKSTAFENDLNKKGQTIDFSAVGAHHQNGAAERAIRTVSDLARANLLHARLYWPDTTELDLWPMAVDYAVYIYNNTPRIDSNLAPIEVWSGCKSDYHALHSAHVWGCPVYVLDPRLQDGKKLPKWQPRSRQGQFLGRSTRHASSAAKVLNLRTGNISTQFHVVFDDWFTTVSSPKTLLDVEQPVEWEELLISSREKLTDDIDDAPPLSNEWLTEKERKDKERYLKQRELRRRQVPKDHRRIHRPDNVEPEIQTQEDVVPEMDEQEQEQEIVVDQDDNMDDDQEDDIVVEEPPPAALRRSTRDRRRPKRYWNDDIDLTDTRLYGGANTATTDWVNQLRSAEREFGILSEEETFIARLTGFMDDSTPASPMLQVHKALIMANTDLDNLVMDLHPLAFASKANSEDLPNFHQAMNSPDAEGWLQAMDIEIEQLLEKDPWEIVSISSIKGKNILDSTWAFCRKRYPDGRVRKLKARWCVRGDQQIEGVDFFETYAPVVGWNTVRLLLILTVTLGLETKQVDFTLGFIHAQLTDEVYVRMPRLYEKPGHVLKLKRSIYGLKQSPKNFFNRVKEGMEARGFKQHTELDPCLFISKNVICLTYVDDCLYFARTEQAIDKAINLLQTDVKDSPAFDLKIEDDVAGYLGILMKKKDDGTIELLQTGLIDRILKIMGLEDARALSTPATKEPLIKDEFGEPCIEQWSYASIVGMMMYLGSNSRPDIAFAVHAAARYTHCPKRIHEQALKRIGRYLKGTRDKGMLVRPTDDCQLDLYTDADFAGLWNIQEADDPVTLRSRTGFVATLGGNPIAWGSKLQTEISLSTTEAEYIAASTAMRSFIPLRRMVHTLLEIFEIEIPKENKMSMVWEDNNGVIKMVEAAYPNMTPRSKHIAIKYHWFREHLNTDFDGATIRMQRVDTKDQLADIFTKGIQGEDFTTKRKLLMGW